MCRVIFLTIINSNHYDCSTGGINFMCFRISMQQQRSDCVIVLPYSENLVISTQWQQL